MEILKHSNFFSYINADYLYRDWDWELDDNNQEIWKTSSPDNFVQFEIRDDVASDGVELYMYIGPKKIAS